MAGWRVTFCAIAATSLVVLAGSTSAKAASKPKKPVAQTYVQVVRDLGAGKYEVEVQNSNPNGAISGFLWAPPVGMKVESITRVLGGKCHIATNTITCSSNIPPPTCHTCEGSSMVIDFAMTGGEDKFVPTGDGKGKYVSTGGDQFIKTSYGGYWIRYAVKGLLVVTSVTPLADLADVPLCAKGQVSSKAHPCLKKSQKH